MLSCRPLDRFVHSLALIRLCIINTISLIKLLYVQCLIYKHCWNTQCYVTVVFIREFIRGPPSWLLVYWPAYVWQNRTAVWLIKHNSVAVTFRLECGLVPEVDVTAASQHEESREYSGREEGGDEDEVKQGGRAVVLEEVAGEPRAEDRPARARRERHARQRRRHLATGRSRVNVGTSIQDGRCLSYTRWRRLVAQKLYRIRPNIHITPI